MLRPADAHPCATAQQPGRNGKAKEAEEAKLTIDDFGLTIVFRRQTHDTFTFRYLKSHDFKSIYLLGVDCIYACVPQIKEILFMVESCKSSPDDR